MTVDLQTAASKNELTSSIDCATSSNISEHCVPNLQGRAASRMQDLIAFHHDFEFYQRKLIMNL